MVRDLSRRAGDEVHARQCRGFMVQENGSHHVKLCYKTKKDRKKCASTGMCLLSLVWRLRKLLRVIANGLNSWRAAGEHLAQDAGRGVAVIMKIRIRRQPVFPHAGELSPHTSPTYSHCQNGIWRSATPLSFVHRRIPPLLHASAATLRRVSNE